MKTRILAVLLALAVVLALALPALAAVPADTAPYNTGTRDLHGPEHTGGAVLHRRRRNAAEAVRQHLGQLS